MPRGRRRSSGGSGCWSTQQAGLRVGDRSVGSDAGCVTITLGGEPLEQLPLRPVPRCSGISCGVGARTLRPQSCHLDQRVHNPTSVVVGAGVCLAYRQERGIPHSAGTVSIAGPSQCGCTAATFMSADTKIGVWLQSSQYCLVVPRPLQWRKRVPRCTHVAPASVLVSPCAARGTSRSADSGGPTERLGRRQAPWTERLRKVVPHAGRTGPHPGHFGR